MQKFLKFNLPIILLLLSVAFVNSVPTSVLVNTKDGKINNSKVKRSSTTNLSSNKPSTSHHSDLDTHSSVTNNNDADGGGSTKAESLFGANQGMSAGVIEPKSTPQKRGVNSQLLYNDIFNSVPTSGVNSGGSGVAVPSGIWSDEIDPSVMYQDLQDFDDYPRSTYRTKPYDNLQNILNAEMYSEPVALPLQYPYRYYGDRKKRSNKKNSFDMRLKRESKLTPADMLALVALVEAGERSRQESENDNESSNDYSRSYFSPYGSQSDDNNEYNGNSWIDPATDYYGMPYNLDSIPRYDVLKDQKLVSNYYPSKRYMITKKKRSLNHFSYPSVSSSSSSFDNNNRFGSTDLFNKGRFQKYF